MTSIIDSCDDDFSHFCLYEESVPQEIWVEIFVRASVKSLLMLKCVCKRWQALITNPSFVKNHLQFQKAISKNKGRFLLQHYNEVKETTNYSLFDEAIVADASLSSFSNNDLLRYSFHNTDMSRVVRIEGPVNGLYCVYGGTDRIVIWNPATKEVHFIPLAGECLPGEYSSYECQENHIEVGARITLGELGFGIDPINEEDYKIVMICEHWDECDQEECYHLLYTMSTNTWRILEVDTWKILEDYAYIDNFHSNNTFLDGFYYWFHRHGEVVVAFDMGKEIFQKISIPNFGSGCRGDLVVHNNRITLLVVNKDLSVIDIWELIAEQSNWIKKKSVVIDIRGVDSSLGFWKNENEMLLVIDGDDQIDQTVLYKTTTREITNLGPRGWGGYFKKIDYYESLVSLRGSINHACSLDAIRYFLSGETTQNVLQRLQALNLQDDGLL